MFKIIHKSKCIVRRARDKYLKNSVLNNNALMLFE